MQIGVYYGRVLLSDPIAFAPDRFRLCFLTVVIRGFVMLIGIYYFFKSVRRLGLKCAVLNRGYCAT